MDEDFYFDLLEETTKNLTVRVIPFESLVSEQDSYIKFGPLRFLPVEI